MVDVTLIVESRTDAAPEVGLAVVGVVVTAEGLLWVRMTTGAGGVELAGEVVEDNRDGTSGLTVDVGFGEDTANVAAEAVVGAAVSVEAVVGCWCI